MKPSIRIGKTINSVALHPQTLPTDWLTVAGGVACTAISWPLVAQMYCGLVSGETGLTNGLFHYFQISLSASIPHPHPFGAHIHCQRYKG
jgi:hypothetical protein